MKVEAKYTIELLKSLIENTPSPLPPTELNWEEFFAFTVLHKVDNMVYAMLLNIEEKVPQDIMERLNKRNNFAIALEANQEISYMELLGAFEEAEIKSIPLKGCILKHLYPMPDYRQSGDIDILVAEEDFSKLAPVMESLGYSEDKDDEFEIHIGYRRPPNVLIEIHKKLVEDSNRTSGYFSRVWERVSLADGYSCCYEMDKETTYTYIIAHLAKHIKNGGAGIRLVLDIWVLLKLWEKDFDKDKLQKALEGANLAEFEGFAHNLAKMWFLEEECQDQNVLALGEYIVDSGIYGNRENSKKIKQSDIEDTKKARAIYRIKKFFRSVFLPYKWIRSEYPILNKYRFLLPVIWVHRVFKLLLSKEIKISDRIKKSVEVTDDAKKLKKIFESVN